MNVAATLPIEKKRWGLWATLGFSLIIVILYLLMQGVVAGIMVGSQLSDNPSLDRDAFLESLMTSGYFLSWSTIASNSVALGLILLFAAIRKGISIKEYLNLTPVSLGVFARWLGIAILIVLVSDGMYLLFGRPIIPDVMIDIYKTAGNVPLLWITIVLVAPLLEEFFFRGFLFEGLRDSRLGSMGAVIITSIMWAMIHVQYEVLEIVLILFLGIILGVAKIKTRSLYITIAMHSLLNLIATMEVAFYLNS